MSSKVTRGRGKGKGEVRVRKTEPLEQRTKNMKFRIDLPEEKQKLYMGAALAGTIVYLAGLVLYIYKMFQVKLGDLRYAVIVVGAGLGIFAILGYIEFFKQKSQKAEIITAEQVTKGCDRVTNISLATSQVFLAVILMELLSRSPMPRWVPIIPALGAVIAYCLAKMISEAVKEVKTPKKKGAHKSGSQKPAAQNTNPSDAEAEADTSEPDTTEAESGE